MGKVPIQDYILKYQPEAASNNDMVWAFDLGKGSIGEAMRRGNEFLHKASITGFMAHPFAAPKFQQGSNSRKWEQL